MTNLNIEQINDQQQGDGTPPTAFGMFDIALIILQNWRLLVLVPIIAGLIAFAVVANLPKRYASTTTWMINDTGPRLNDPTRTIESLLLSPAVLDAVIAAHPDVPGDTPAQKRRGLGDRIKWSVTPGDTRKTANIYYMAVEDQIPARAQSFAKVLIEQWLLLTKPRPDAKARLEAELARTEARVREADVLLEKFSLEAKNVVTPNNMQGELATPFEKLRDSRTVLIQLAQKIRLELAGGSRDMILSGPDLPTEPVSTGRSVAAALTAAGVFPLILLGLLLRHWFRTTMRERNLQVARGSGRAGQ
jgi:hypothetical protein